MGVGVLVKMEIGVGSEAKSEGWELVLVRFSGAGEGGRGV